MFRNNNHHDFCQRNKRWIMNLTSAPSGGGRDRLRVFDREQAPRRCIWTLSHAGQVLQPVLNATNFRCRNWYSLGGAYVTPSCLVEAYRRIGETHCLHLQCLRISSDHGFSCSLLLVICLLGLYFFPEGGRNTFLRKASTHLLGYTASSLTGKHSPLSVPHW
jgi:hypothetical protein